MAKENNPCEKCGELIKISTLYSRTNLYKTWISLNAEARKTGMGAELCWRCWRNNKKIQQAIARAGLDTADIELTKSADVELTKRQKEFSEGLVYVDYVTLVETAERKDEKDEQKEKDAQKVGRILERLDSAGEE